MPNNKIRNPLRYHRPTTSQKPQFRNIDKTLELLEKEHNELKIKLTITSCSTKLTKEREKKVSEIENRLELQDEILEDIKTKKSNIEHLKLGIKEVDSKAYDLSTTAISEYQHGLNLKRAKRIKENLEGRFAALKRKEGGIIAENSRLNEMIEKMVIDRDLFSQKWIKLDNQLAANKTFLIAKADKLALIFSEGDYLRGEMRAINEKAKRFEAMHLAEARNMVRKIVVDKNSLQFMAGKLNKRVTGSEENKIQTRIVNAREMNAQLIARKRSISKELQVIYRKINQIFDVLSLDDRLDDFDFEKIKGTEYQINKLITELDIQLNIVSSDYSELKNPAIKKRMKSKSHSREKVKPTAVKEVAKRQINVLVTPIDVVEIRNNTHYITPPNETETSDLEALAKLSNDDTDKNVSENLSNANKDDTEIYAAEDLSKNDN